MKAPPEDLLARATAVLAGKDQALRVEAAHDLCELADDEALPPQVAARIVELTEDANAEIRATAVIGVARALEPSDALPVVSRRASDGDWRVRAAAVNAAAGLRLPQARPLFAVALQDSEFPVRVEAAIGLAGLKHAAGLEVLVEALSNRVYRFDALGALSYLEDARALPAVCALFRRFLLSGFDRTQAAGALARLGDPEGRRYLMKRIERRRGDDRGLALELCGELKIGEALAALFATLGDRRDRFRGAAARALGELGGDRAMNALSAVLADEEEDPDVRMDAAEGLMRLGTSSARQALDEGVRKARNPDVRAAAAEALAHLAAPGAD